MGEATSLIRELFESWSAWDPRRRDRIVTALVAIGPPAAPELVETLGNWSSRSGVSGSLTVAAARSAIRALGEIGDARALTVLTQVGARHTTHLSRPVAEALAQLGDRDAIPFLLSMLLPEESLPFEARLAAVIALAALAERQDLELLSRGLWVLADEQEGAARGLRDQACGAIADRLLSFRTAAAIPALLARPFSQYVTPEALAEIGLDGIPNLVHALDLEARFQSMQLRPDLALFGLIELGEAAIPGLWPYVRTTPSERGNLCAVALCLVGAVDDELIAPVVLALDQFGWAQGMAVQAFERLLAQSHNPALRAGMAPLRKLSGSIRFSSEDRAHCRRLAWQVEARTSGLSTLPIAAVAAPADRSDLPIVDPLPRDERDR